MIELNRSSAPPPAGPEIWIRRLAKNEEVLAAIVSPCFWGLFVHWAGNRSEPCFKETKTCPGHRRGLPLKWKGYLYVHDMTKRKMEFLEFPPGAAQQLLDRFPEGHSLRGEVILVRRMSGNQARLQIAVETHKWAGNQGVIPPDKDPAETLAKLWGLDPSQVNLNGDVDIPKSKFA